MDDMVERVERAIMDRMRLACGPGDLARAAIEAMREPTDPMVDAAREAHYSGASAVETYKAAISAALTNPKP